MGKKARIGFIGVGDMGRTLLKAAVANPKAEVTALCDIDPEALAKASDVAGNGVPTFDRHEKLLSAGELDGVVVAAPQYAHPELSIAALQAGCHTFCEKPMALDVSQCETMLAAAKAAGKGLMIGQVLRYLHVYRFALDKVRSGGLGKPFAARIIRNGGPWGAWRGSWRLNRETCGGSLFEVSVHEIDLLLCLLGRPVAVMALGANYINDALDFEDNITAQISFADGSMGSINSGACDFHGRNTGEIYCEQGTIYYDNVAREARIARKDEEKEVIPFDDIGKDYEPGVAREVREFIEACLGEHDITIPGEQGMQAVEVAQAAYLSAREKRIVELPLPR